MTKLTKITAGILIALLVLGLGAELALGWMAYQRLTQAGDTLNSLREENVSLREELSGLHEEVAALIAQAQEPEDPAQEDGVRIAGEYMIRSTLPISDAYRSGDSSALSDKGKETLRMAADILESIITPEMDDYEKEEAVYIWMTENLNQDEGLLPVIPRTQADCDNPYGVLKYHNAVCVGYATTFRLFMQMLDIPCMVVHNSECYHSWDLVQLGGGWYHTDIYSDAGSSSFMHFNLTDSMQGSSQSWNTDFFPPACQTEYCYAYRSSVQETDLYRIPAALRQAIDDQSGLMALRFTEMDETGARIAEMMLNDIQNRIEYSALSNALYIYWNWMPLDQGWLLSVNLNWYNQGEEPEPEELPDEVYEKIQEAVEDAFGDMPEGYDWDSEEDLDWEEAHDWHGGYGK